MAKFPCRVCGLEHGRDMWKPPSHHICYCCLSELGIDDVTLRMVEYRRMVWLTSGAEWGIEEKKPDKWTMKEMTDQLKNIPPEWWYPT